MRIDASLTRECPDPQEFRDWKGRGIIEYAKYLDAEYDVCQERQRALAEAARAATE